MNKPKQTHRWDGRLFLVQGIVYRRRDEYGTSYCSDAKPDHSTYDRPGAASKVISRNCSEMVGRLRVVALEW